MCFRIIKRETKKSDKHVVGLKDVDEGLQWDNLKTISLKTNNHTNPYSGHSTRKSKKLYRDKDKGLIGGVSAGLRALFWN
jgi:hypothetical protein